MVREALNEEFEAAMGGRQPLRKLLLREVTATEGAGKDLTCHGRRSLSYGGFRISLDDFVSHVTARLAFTRNPLMHSCLAQVRYLKLWHAH